MLSRLFLTVLTSSQSLKSKLVTWWRDERLRLDLCPPVVHFGAYPLRRVAQYHNAPEITCHNCKRRSKNFLQYSDGQLRCNSCQLE